MSRQDPGQTTGQAEYPPVAPLCQCGQIEAVHEVRAGRRGRCSAGGPAGPSTCTRYQPGGDR